MVVPVEVVAPGAYAFFLEHGTGEVSTALVSSAGVVVDASAEEAGEEEEEEEGDATGSKWAQGIVASLVVSFCRSVNLVVTWIFVFTPKRSVCCVKLDDFPYSFLPLSHRK